MIGQPHVLESAAARGGEHLENGVAPVRECRVNVKRPAQVLEPHERALSFSPQIVGRFAPLRRNVRQLGPLEDILLRLRWLDVAECRDEFFGARRTQQRRAELLRLREMKVHGDAVLRAASKCVCIDRFQISNNLRQ